VKEGGK